MDLTGLRDYCLSMDGVTEKTPFGRFARRFDSILVFYVRDHMFCLTDMDDFTYVTVRLTPEEVEDVQTRHSSVSAPFNLDPKYWIQLNFGGDLSAQEIRDLVSRAYVTVRAKYTRKR